jgi:hypothetical protein
MNAIALPGSRHEILGQYLKAIGRLRRALIPPRHVLLSAKPDCTEWVDIMLDDPNRNR